MRRNMWRFCMGFLLISSFTLGCHRAAIQQKQPPDPLLVSKKPIEGKSVSANPTPTSDPTARRSPVAPVMPGREPALVTVPRDNVPVIRPTHNSMESNGYPPAIRTTQPTSFQQDK